jgi:sec-independent protein translocase protein TatA
MSATHALLLAGLPGGWEVWIILLVVLILFGSRIPKVARSLGQGISQFKKGLNDAVDLGGDDDEDARPAKPEEKKLESGSSSSES